jgi:methyl-accepting chemotaxis protein
MIVRLQSASNDAVNVMTTSRSICEHTLSDAQTTARMIKTMNLEIDNITQMTVLIATAVEEQSCVSNEISEQITSINDVAYENVTAASQVSLAGQDMNVIASQLSELTHQFQVKK